MNRKRLDFSTGDPLLPLTAVANYAFREARKDLNVYQVTNRAGLGETVGEILCETGDYFTARKMHDPGWTGLGTRSQLMTGGGTTEAYELVIRAIATDIRDREKSLGQPMKPVIVMPVPTYGYFCENARNWGLEIAAFPRNMEQGGRVEPQALLDFCRELHRQGKRVVAYYDSNPNNPTGHVRTREETIGLAKVLEALNEFYRRQDEKLRSEMHEAKKPDRLYDWRESLCAHVSVIDDMVYDGLEYAGQPQAYPFARLGADGKDEGEGEFRNFFRNTFTLLGPSKAGLVNVRAGMLIGDDKYINDMRKMQLTTSYFPPKMSMHALQAWFSDKEPFATWRRDHLEKLNHLHRRNGLLMKALVNGIGSMPEATRKDKAEITALLCEAGKMTPAQARKRLAQGIEGVHVTTTPQSGFFHLLDLNALKGTHYNNDLTPGKCYAGTTEFESEYGVDHLSRGAGLAFAFGSWMHLPEDDLTVRVSFAKPAAEIVEFAKRLESMVGLLQPAPQQAAKPAPQCA